MGLLRTLLILSIIYFSYRIFVHVLAPLLLKIVIKKAQKNYNERMEHKYDDTNNSEIKITNAKNSRKKSIHDQDGEYVDYEEIK